MYGQIYIYTHDRPSSYDHSKPPASPLPRQPPHQSNGNTQQHAKHHKHLHPSRPHPVLLAQPPNHPDREKKPNQHPLDQRPRNRAQPKRVIHAALPSTTNTTISRSIRRVPSPSSG